MATFGQIPSNVPFNNFQVVTSSTCPGSPSEGDHIYETDTGLTYFYNGTDWQPTTGQFLGTTTGSVSGASSPESDANNMATVTITTVAGQQVLLMWNTAVITTSDGSSHVRVNVRRGSTVLRSNNLGSVGNTSTTGHSIGGVIPNTPGAGTHVYKLTLGTSFGGGSASGGGTLTVVAA